MLRTNSVSEQETLLTAPPVTVAPRKETKAERRYDAKTVEAAVALAAKMQTEHQETFSSEELETIAAEAGIRPEFMRRALAAVATETTGRTSRETIRLRRAKTVRKRSRGLNAERLALIFGLPVAYCLPLFFIVVALLEQYNSVSEAGMWTFMGLIPGLLAIVMGAVLRSKRQGIIAGAWLSVLVTLTFTLVDMAFTGGSNVAGFFPFTAAFVGAGAALGLLGGSLPALAAIIHGGDAPQDEEWAIR